MKWGRVAVAVGVAVAVSLSVYASIRLSEMRRTTLAQAQARLDEAKATLEIAQRSVSFSCGYLFGQRAIISRLAPQLPLPKTSEVMLSTDAKGAVPVCSQYRGEALANGFRAVADDQGD